MEHAIDFTFSEAVVQEILKDYLQGMTVVMPFVVYTFSDGS